ncbi:MAG: response regulator transcription factor [Phaeodactylibacter sp.]|nr:response regulator transcription factor [Phaeodactylibacter sp.]
MIKAVILDDELDSIETLEWKINQYCPEVSIVQTFNDPVKGLEFLKQQPIDLLFLDIEMPRLNGFDVLQSLETIPFDVIFTTAYDDFGIQAIKFSALDYLLKPVQINDLQMAVEKYQKKNDGPKIHQEQIELLFANIQREKIGKPGLIALATKESIEYVHPDEIIVCCSDSNYTMIHFGDGRKKLIARTLKEFDLMLSAYNFFRPHNSYLVNLTKVKEYVRSDGGYLILRNDMKIPVSKSKREEFLRLMG